MFKKERGITLIALIVTIIVLLILAGVTISLAIKDQGVFSKAKTAGNAYKSAQTTEQTGLNTADEEMQNIMNQYNIK